MKARVGIGSASERRVGLNINELLARYKRLCARDLGTLCQWSVLLGTRLVSIFKVIISEPSKMAYFFGDFVPNDICGQEICGSWEKSLSRF